MAEEPETQGEELQVPGEDELTEYEYYAKMGEEYGFSPKKSQELSLYL